MDRFRPWIMERKKRGKSEGNPRNQSSADKYTRSVRAGFYNGGRTQNLSSVQVLPRVTLRTMF